MANISQNVNIEMLEKLPDGTYKLKYPKTKASQVKLEDTEDNFVATEVEGAMSELFTNVSNGKDLVGGAITDVDDSVVIPTDPTFYDLASGIGQISTGKKWASGDAFPPDNSFTMPLLEFEPSLIIATYINPNNNITENIFVYIKDSSITRRGYGAETYQAFVVNPNYIESSQLGMTLTSTESDGALKFLNVRISGGKKLSWIAFE